MKLAKVIFDLGALSQKFGTKNLRVSKLPSGQKSEVIHFWLGFSECFDICFSGILVFDCKNCKTVQQEVSHFVCLQRKSLPLAAILEFQFHLKLDFQIWNSIKCLVYSMYWT